MLKFFKKSRRILGMNARNLHYIRPFNLKTAKQLADNKIASKHLLKKNGLPVSALLAKIRNIDELEQFGWNILPESFALKPCRGFGGEGILVVYGKKKNEGDIWIKADGTAVTVDDLKNHIRNIIDGSFSLANVPDVAFFEERLKLLKLFKPYSYKGIPDIRVIVFNKVPIMAMLRIPTKESGGKANLHQGAIGIGIDLASGVTTTAVYRNNIIEYLPGSRLLLSGIRIPYWKDILRLAVQAQEVTKLGYLGADIAIDKDRGPVILELNARPGLSIQIANLDGLKGRLERVEGLKIKSIDRGIAVGMNLFGGEIEEEVEDISGRKVIGSIEKIKLVGKDGKEIEVEAKIDTGAYSTSIDTELAKTLGFSDILNFFSQIDIPTGATREQWAQIEKDLDKKYAGAHPDLAGIVAVISSSGTTIRPKVPIRFVVNGMEISANVTVIDRSSLNYPVIIGRKNLGKFLIDVNKI